MRTKNYATNLKRRLLESNGGKCAYCMRPMSLEECTIDHDHPKIRGGSNLKNNKVPSCLECNREKSCLTGPEYARGIRHVRIRGTHYAMIRQSRNLSPESNVLIPIA